MRLSQFVGAIGVMGLAACPDVSETQCMNDPDSVTLLSCSSPMVINRVQECRDAVAHCVSSPEEVARLLDEVNRAGRIVGVCQSNTESFPLTNEAQELCDQALGSGGGSDTFQD